MDLAKPAPRVSDCRAESVRHEEPAHAEPARPAEAASVLPAQSVEPAEVVQDPRKWAPSNASSPTPQSDIGVEALRKLGVDFGSKVAISQGAPKKNFLKKILPKIFDMGDFITFSEIARYVVVKDSSCFVFLEETDLHPLCAFSLDELTAVVEDPNNKDPRSLIINPATNTNQSRVGLSSVLLEYKSNGKLAYQFTFDTLKDGSVVQRFVDLWNGKKKFATTEVIAASVVPVEKEL